MLIGIGTLLDHRIPKVPPKKLVFGAGVGYGRLPDITSDWRFLCVRGPRTAAALKLPSSTILGDSAMLVRELMMPSDKMRDEVSFMPHHESAHRGDWEAVCRSTGFRYLDPTIAVEITLNAIRESSLVISEAMHGIIVADALRVPWIPVCSSPHVLELKWHDWSESVGIEHSFEWLPPLAPHPVVQMLQAGLFRPARYLVRRYGNESEVQLRRLLWLARLGRRSTAGDDTLRERLLWLARFGRRRLSHDRAYERTYRRMREALQGLIAEARVQVRLAL